jgi:hypothetical protein
MRSSVYVPAIALAVIAGGCCGTSARRQAQTPTAVVGPAEPVNFRGANSPGPGQPGETDCNSPAHWDGDTLYIFNSAGHPWRSSGTDVFHLTGDYRRVEYNNKANGGRWIECTVPDPGSRTLYGWYHLEPTGICPGAHPDPKMNLTAPRIGAVRSSDNGATWEDLGIVLDSPPALRCDTKNYYFAGGNGDFSAMLDRRGEYLYLFFSTYVGDVSEQGVGVARMRWADRNSPTGKVYKWHQGKWSEAGLQGRSTIIYPAFIDWHREDANAFWGPSIHWNTHLREYVILLNRSKDSRWGQEGIYVSFNRDLANPAGWSAPVKILESTGADRWYPQVIGLNAAERETDKLAGREARLFVRGQSRWEILLLRPGEHP